MQRFDDEIEIEGQAGVLDVIEFVFEFVQMRNIVVRVAVADLRPAGEARFHAESQVIEGDHLRQAVGIHLADRSQAHHAELALEDIPQLGQLIQPGLAQPFAHSGHARVFGLSVGCFALLLIFVVHGSEFGNGDGALAHAQTLLAEDGRAGRIQLDQNHQQGPEGQGEEQAQGGQKDVHDPLHLAHHGRAVGLAEEGENPAGVDGLDGHASRHGAIKIRGVIHPDAIEFPVDGLFQILRGEAGAGGENQHIDFLLAHRLLQRSPPVIQQIPIAIILLVAHGGDGECADDLVISQRAIADFGLDALLHRIIHHQQHPLGPGEA